MLKRQLGARIKAWWGGAEPARLGIGCKVGFRWLSAPEIYRSPEGRDGTLEIPQRACDSGELEIRRIVAFKKSEIRQSRQPEEIFSAGQFTVP